MDKNKTTVEIHKWWKITADDHHDFWKHKNAYQQAGLDVTYREIICEDGSSKYEAIFWVGDSLPEDAAYKYFGAV
jgi:hypothetical protein